MDKLILSIFTPTFNRAYILPTLYESLKRQNNKLFQWIIVDDGSTDETAELIAGWEKESIVPILYYYQENQGKMQAHNLGVEKCTTELFLCVDSDDHLIPNAINIIIDNWNKNKIDKCCGIVGRRLQTSKNNNKSDEIFNNEQFSSLNNLYRLGYKGETALIFKTEILKEYKMPIIPGEKFIGESYIYDLIDQKYKYKVVSDYLTKGEYLEDGYTSNMLQIKKENPKGYAMCYNLKMSLNTTLPYKILYASEYVAFSLLSKYCVLKTIKKANSKWLTIFSFPFGCYKYLKYKMK